MKRKSNSYQILFSQFFVISNFIFISLLRSQSSGTADNLNFNLIKGEGGGTYTGEVQLRFPVMTVPGRNGLDYTINLNYQSGVRFKKNPCGSLSPQQSGWVGRGFNIQIGSITRSVVGRVDEQTSDWFQSPTNFNLTDASNHVDEATGIMHWTVIDNNEYWDTYFLNMIGGSNRILPFWDTTLSFYSFRAQDYKPWQIFFNIDEDNRVWGSNFPGIGTLNNFMVTTEDGTNYFFGHKSNLEIKNNGTLLLRFPVSWELTEIHSRDYVDQSTPLNGASDDDDGSWVKISYTNTGKIDLGFDQNVIVGVGDPLTDGSGGLVYGATCYDRYAFLNYDTSHISQIETPTHKAIFGTSPRIDGKYGVQLNEITLVRKSDGEIVKKIVFYYRNDAGTGLELDSIQEKGNTISDDKPPMKFEYYGNLGLGGEEMLGYKGGSYSLKKIRYPEGGTVQYIYDQNSYNWFFNNYGDNWHPEYPMSTTCYSSTPFSVGGARLSQMDVSDGMGSTKTWKYYYGEGFLEQIPRSFQAPYQFNFGTKLGTHVGYRSVRTVLPDNNGSITQYFTTGASSSYYQISGTPTPSIDSREAKADYASAGKIVYSNPKRGKIWKTVDSTSSGSIASINEEYFNFTLKGIDTTYGHANNHCNEYSYSSRRDSSVVIQDGIRKSIIYAGYSNLNELPDSIYEWGSRITDNVNPYTHSRYGRLTLIDYWDNMFDEAFDLYIKNIITIPFKKYVYDIDVNPPNQYPDYPLLDWRITHCDLQSWSGYNPFQYCYVGNGASDLTSPSGKGWVITQDSIQYDSYGNIIQGKDGNKIFNTTVWGWKGTVPIGQVSNAKYNQVAIANYDDNSTTGWNIPNGGTWSIQTGEYTSNSSNGWNNPSYFSLSSNVDVVIEGDLFTTSGSQASLVKYVNLTNYVRFELDYSTQKVRITTCKNGASLFLETAYSLSYNGWYHLRGEIQGSTARLYINGSLLLTYTNANVSLSQGYCGLMSSSASVRYDNIRFYPIDAQAVSMSYDPSVLKVNCSIDKNGIKTYFNYDSRGRLIDVKDQYGNCLKKYIYTYSRNITGYDTLDASKPNCVQEIIFRSSTDSTVSKKYFDGLGRVIQSQIVDGANDIIMTQSYDALGRIAKTYKPYSINLGANAHKYDPNFATNADSYYNSQLDGHTNGYPYSQNVYSNDPLGRVITEGAPGSVYRVGAGFEKEFQFTTNTLLDSLIINYQGDPNPIYSWYLPSEVYKQTSIDENGNSVKQYIDPLGFVDAVQSHAGTTMFVCNAEGQILEVFDPKHFRSFYTYGRLSKMDSKYSVDAGNVFYGYDKNGNLRMTLDQNHIGAPNNVSINGSVSGAGSTTNTLQLTKPGKVTLSFSIISGSGTPSVSITYNGGIIAKVISAGTPTPFILPKGTYSYTASAGGANISYSITSNMGYEFSYNKYDSHNRLTESGEYEYNSSSANNPAVNSRFIYTYPQNSYYDDFNQIYADSAVFPTSNKLVTKTITYDFPSSDPLGTGQHNLTGNISTVTGYQNGAAISTSFYSYDSYGRTEWMVTRIPGTSDKKISYWYDLQGNITKKCVTDLTNYTLYTTYEYDQLGRLLKVYTNTIDSQTGRIKEAEFTYYANGKTKRLQLGNAQGVDYVYNERDWLTQINQQNFNSAQDPGGDGANGIPLDKFAEIIGYHNLNHIAAGSGFTPQAQYNGNISWSFVRTSGAALEGVNAGYADPMIGYVYNYDNANRLTKADFGYYHTSSGWSNSLPKAAMYELPSISYDKNGNITALQRYGVNATIVDNLAYSYGASNNQIASITNTASGSQTDSYLYDSNGNIIADTYRSIKHILYNENNLPEQMVKNDGTVAQYKYDASGNRVRKQYGTADEIYVLGPDGQTEAVFGGDNSLKFFNINAGDNIGRCITLASDLNLSNTTLTGDYKAINTVTAQTSVVVTGTAALKSGTRIRLLSGFRASAGCNFRASIGSMANEASHYYYLKDHLGSVRVTVDQSGVVKGYDDYDPWGMTLPYRSQNIADNNDKFKFTGKERDDETNYDYFGARYYDARIGRWMQVDPLDEKYLGWSPYNYVLNNPVANVDPDGKYSVKSIGGRVFITRYSFWNTTAVKSIGIIPSAPSVFVMGYNWARGDVFFTPSPGEVIWNVTGGKLLSEVGAFLFDAGSVALETDEILEAIRIDADIFNELLKEKDGDTQVFVKKQIKDIKDGVIQNMEESDGTVIMINDEIVKKRFKGNIKEAEKWVEGRMYQMWMKKNPRLYNKLTGKKEKTSHSTAAPQDATRMQQNFQNHWDNQWGAGNQ